jgi:translation initiation factor 3 subunit H
MEDDKCLDLTDTFPFALNIQEELEQEEYQLEMMKTLRDVNVDNNTVGWYQSCSFDSFLSQSLLEAQFNFQSTIPNSIVLIYDQARSVQGPPCLKALRLKPEFMEAIRDKRAKFLNRPIDTRLFDELSVSICLTSLEQIFLVQLTREDVSPVGFAPVIETELLVQKLVANNLCSSLDDFVAETGRIQHYLRTTAKQQQALNAQLQRLKHDNAQRSQAGEDAVPVTSVMANFRPTSEPSKLPCQIASGSVHVLLDEYKSHEGLSVVSTTMSELEP